MKSTAPARSGNFSCRLAPRLPVAAIALSAMLSFALLAAGCASAPGAPSAPGSPQAAASASPSEPAPANPQARPADPAAPAGATDTTASGQPAADPPPPGGSSSAAEPPDDVGPIPTAELNPQLMFQLLASEIAAQRGQLASASSTYLAMARQVRDPRLARRATELALADRSLERALPGAELWYALAPDSRQAAQTLEMLLLGAGRLTEAEPLLNRRLASARAEGRLAQAYDELQQSLARTNDANAAMSLLERLAAQDADLAEARLALAAQAATAGDAARARLEAAAAMKLAPNDEIVAVRAARHVAESEAGPDTAIGMLESFVASKPDAIEARFALARLLAGAGRNEAARAQFESVLQTEPENPTLLFALAQLAWQSEQPDAAERYLQRYLALPDTINRNPSPAWLFLGQISESGGRIDEAIERYSKVDRGEQYIPALVRRVLLIARQGRVEEARQLLRSTRVTTNRERVQLISAEAQVLREARRFDDALTLLSNALERLPENPDLLYDHAMAAERVGRLDLLEGSLRKLISLRPDHAHAYNALGYTFADRNIRLQEARELIEKALDLRPDDAHILDSMGWVRYRLGDLDGALDFLRRAWRASREAEIGVHLGEILWVRGEREEARAVFRESRELDPNNEVLRETLQRLGVGP